MNYDFTVNGIVFARFGTPTVHLQRALSGYVMQVVLPSQLEPKRTDAPHVVIDHRLALSIQLGGQLLPIGKAEADSRLWLIPRNFAYTNNYSYSLALSSEQLMRIETARSAMSGPLQFHFRLEVVAMVIGKNDTLAGQGSGSAFEVPVEHWITQLQRCEFANKTIFEIDLPIDPGQAIDASPGGYLKSAHKAFVNGQFAHCATQCRIALETLTKQLGDWEEIKPMGATKPDREKLSARDRIRILRRELTRIASVSAHTSPSGDLSDFELTRSETALILASTAGVIATSAPPH